MAVPGSIGKKEIFYLPIGHHLKYEQGLQIRSTIGQLLGKGPVLLYFIGNFHTIDINDLSQLSTTDLTISPKAFRIQAL